MTSDFAMFWPMVAQAALIFILYGLLMYRRMKYSFTSAEAIRAYGERGEEARESALVNKNIANQFETPVLFFVACIVLFFIDADNLATVSLAWLYVFTRYVHSFVHVTSNSLRLRAPSFALGLLFLLLLWVWIPVWMLAS